LARSRAIHLQRWQVVLALFALISVLTLLSGTVYHFKFLKAAREGWPVVSQIVRLVVRDEFAQRDRFMRENLDAIARKVGEVQAISGQTLAVIEHYAKRRNTRYSGRRAMNKWDGNE
jgi:hypothetical protein